MLVERDGLADVAVCDFLNLAYFLGREFLEVGEVETQYFGRYERTFLLYVSAEYLAERLVQQVGGSVVARCTHAHVLVDCGSESCFGIIGQFLHDVYAHAVLALGVHDFRNFAGGKVGEGTAVSYLAAHLGVERCFGEYYLVVFAVFLLNVAIAKNFGVAFGAVVADEFLFAVVHVDPVGGLNCGSGACAFFLCVHLALEALVVEGHAVILKDKFCKVEWESVSIV